MILKLIETGLLLAHIVNYKEYLIKIGSNFVITFALKRIFKSINDPFKADMLGLSGYTLTFSSIIDYLVAVKEAGTCTPDNTAGVSKEFGGLIPELIEAIKEAINK